MVCAGSVSVSSSIRFPVSFCWNPLCIWLCRSLFSLCLPDPFDEPPPAYYCYRRQTEAISASHLGNTKWICLLWFSSDFSRSKVSGCNIVSLYFEWDILHNYSPMSRIRILFPKVGIPKAIIGLCQGRSHRVFAGESGRSQDRRNGFPEREHVPLGSHTK